MAGRATAAGRATVRSPTPLIVTTPFALETDVDDGTAGTVDVVDVVDVATRTTVDVVDEPVPSVG